MMSTQSLPASLTLTTQARIAESEGLNNLEQHNND